MLDLKLITEEGERLKKALASRNAKLDLEPILRAAKKRGDLIQKTDALRAKRNEVSAQVGQLKKKGQDTNAIQKEMKTLGEDLKNLEQELEKNQAELDRRMLELPNLPHASV